MKGAFLLISIFLLPFYLCSQNIKSISIDENANGVRLDAFLQEVEQKHDIDFIYEEDALNGLMVSGVDKKMYLSHYLAFVLEPFKLKVVKVKSNLFLIIDEAEKMEYGTRKGNYLILKSQGTPEIIVGQVKDGDTNEAIPGAHVVDSQTEKGVLTDVNGNFSIRAPGKLFRLDIRYLGFETVSYLVAFSTFGAERRVEVTISPQSMELEEVTITSEGTDRNVKSQITGIEKLGIETIKKLPTFLGEIDPVKSLTTLPGVSTVGELSSGFNVRGGESGQNLIIQDGAIIYNPTHLFGFFSAFNPDFVKDVTLYKGGGPARFGSRVSSVLEVNLRNGNASRHSVSGGLGIISSRIGVEGPILKDRVSYLVGGRISYSNWLLRAVKNIQLQNSSAKFNDITAKVFAKINESNFISVTGYKSADDFSLASDSVINWGTTNASLKWGHTFKENLFSTLSFSSSNYYSGIENMDQAENFSYRNGVNNLWLKYDFVFKKEESAELNFGFDAVGTKLEPGKLKPLLNKGNTKSIDIEDQKTLETALYIQGNIDLNPKWAISAGLRYSNFIRVGKDNIYSFNYNNFNGRYPAIIDSVQYGAGEIIKKYGGFEPRFSLRYLVDENTSIKGSYNRTYQYLHLISNTASATPQDYWVASGPYLRPEIGDQVSLGVFRNLQNNSYELSLEGYYKLINNTVDYIDGADITLNKALEAGLMNGKGLAYGLELLARKNEGKLFGWVSYTFSRSLRQFQANEYFEGINEGDYYPAPYDQPHNLSLILNYKLGKRTTLSSNFSYSTGRPITIPISKFSYDAYLAVLNYSERNQYRIPDYHRWDLSLSIEGVKKKNSRFYGGWVFSIFNVYSRNNAYSIFFSKYGTANKVSILGSVFPSVNYNFKF